ncbi:FecR family protein [Steroidobacter sp.]|uniref:FecR family protein n=1 Tax=Steroidobacter sp. TaxID=1978227 RepID=UPI001A522C7C|nr:FecR domain-containing protein [Steroidobacter sp.]MBL8265271.1 FecR domain-containing protein [Steroidobacter sp.]
MTAPTPINGMNDDSNPVLQRAIQWLSDLQDGQTDSASLFRWLAESPRHVEEFCLVLTFADEIAGLTEAQCADIRAMNSAKNPAPAVISINETVAQPLRSEISPRRWAVAASVALAILVGGLLWWDGGWKTYATDFGEQRVVELPDGSAMHLNIETRAQVKYSDTGRDIRLLRGEALFKVKHDPAHPFRVHADDNVIQALGTQFNVYRRSHETTVAVLEGSVRIISGATSSVATEKLLMGQEARIAASEPVQLRPVDAKQVAAWRQHRLVFQNDTLDDIAAEFNRYNRRPKIRILDEHAGARRFAATFDADAPESLLQILQTRRELAVEQSGNEILVRSRELPPAVSESR